MLNHVTYRNSFSPQVHHSFHNGDICLQLLPLWQKNCPGDQEQVRWFTFITPIIQGKVFLEGQEGAVPPEVVMLQLSFGSKHSLFFCLNHGITMKVKF